MKLNTCAWGIHISMDIPESEAALGIEASLDKEERKAQGIRSQK